jgi:hypothetical protein
MEKYCGRIETQQKGRAASTRRYQRVMLTEPRVLGTVCGNRPGADHASAAYLPPTSITRQQPTLPSVHAYRAFCAATFGSEDAIDRLILGHTHRQVVYYLRDDMLWMNPGSVSYRRLDDPDQAAHYATITDGQIALKQLAYDHGVVFGQIDQVELKESESAVARWFFGPRTQG